MLNVEQTGCDVLKLGLITFEATIEEVEADRSSFVDSFKDVVVAQFAAAGVTVAAEDVIVTDISHRQCRCELHRDGAMWHGL